MIDNKPENPPCNPLPISINQLQGELNQCSADFQLVNSRLNQLIKLCKIAIEQDEYATSRLNEMWIESSMPQYMVEMKRLIDSFNPPTASSEMETPATTAK